MAKITLVVGGNRSGKTAFAETLACSEQGERYYIATAPLIDHEIKARIALHRQARTEQHWNGTIEEELDILRVFSATKEGSTYLLDSLGMWINNLLHHKILQNEFELIQKWQEILTMIQSKNIRVIFIADEVGLGTLPADQLSRRFCDLNGRINQLVATAAEDVVMVSCGLAVRMK